MEKLSLHLLTSLERRDELGGLEKVVGETLESD